MEQKTEIKRPVYSDIRFWIVLFFFIRLYGIWFAPLDLSHNWRQTTVTMVARNFVETDNNILYPRIDIAGEKSGITGMEFPVLNYSIYLISLIFGYQHWYGRLIVLLVSCLGIWFFYKLCRKYCDEKTAFASGIVLLFSIWFTYSRKIMPDTFSMSLILAGIWFGISYLEKNKISDLLIYFLCISTGLLSKMPSGYILVLLVPLLLNRNFKAGSRILLGIASVLGGLLTIYWYFVWVPYLNDTYGFKHFFMGKSLGEGAMELAGNMEKTLSKFYDVAIKYIGFAFFIFGIYKAVKLKNRTLIFILIAGFAAFLPIMLKAGFTFYHHSYYIIPFVPVMALMSGYGISQLVNRKAYFIVLIAIGLEGILNHMDDFRIKKEYKPVLELESIMDRISGRDELIAVNSGAFPTPFYFAHRHGWPVFNGQLQSASYTDSLKNKGLKLIVIMKHVFGEDIELPYKEVFNNSEFRIYRLED